MTTFACALALLLVGYPTVYNRLSTEGARFVQSLRVSRLSKIDTDRLERGYYENLLNVERGSSQLWEV